MEVKLRESQRLMEKIYQSYSNVLSGLSGRQSGTGLPVERMATIKEQFENLKEMMGSMLTFRRKPPNHSHHPEDVSAG
jgi:hypothetical protein